jgi:hypothetical protein
MTRHFVWEAGEDRIEVEDGILSALSDNDSLFEMKMHFAKLLAHLHEQGAVTDAFVNGYAPWRYELEKIE